MGHGSSRLHRGKGKEQARPKQHKVPKLERGMGDESQQGAALHAAWVQAVEQLRTEIGRLERINRSTMSSGFDVLFDSLPVRATATLAHVSVA